MSDTLIITGGGSQLLTQITTLKHLDIPTSGADVYYIGLPSGSLDTCMSQICQQFEMKYHGHLVTPPNYPGISFRTLIENLLKLNFSLKPSRLIWKIITRRFLHLRKISGKTVLINVRHKCIEDIFLLTALKPKQCLLTADGLVHNLEKRNFSGFRWIGVDNTLAQFPLTTLIYTPEYLARETQKLGNAGILSDKSLTDTFDKAANIDLYNTLEKKVLNETTPPQAIIFSQHLSLMEVCTEAEEIAFYEKLTERLLHETGGPVMFKPHPRDSRDKIEFFINHFKNKNVICLTPEQAALPIELCYRKLHSSKPLLATCSSSAPLALNPDLSDIRTYSSAQFSSKFQNEIREFSQSFKLGNETVI